MQCKDIEDKPVLQYLADNSPEFCWWGLGGDRDVALAMPKAAPSKLVLAKMRRLMKRGLVDGCSCGCRGDFVITDKGRDYLQKEGTIDDCPSGAKKAHHRRGERGVMGERGTGRTYRMLQAAIKAVEDGQTVMVYGLNVHQIQDMKTMAYRMNEQAALKMVFGPHESPEGLLNDARGRVDFQQFIDHSVFDYPPQGHRP